MKKLLSIVISILMISAMMSAVAFADGEQITLAGTMTGLVAGEAVTLTPTITVDGATTYTVEVNSQVFGITGGTAVDGGKTIIKKENIPVANTFELTVNASIPQTFTSDIEITAGEVSQKFTISVADRIIGDVNGDTNVDLADAIDIMTYLGNPVGNKTLNLSASYKNFVGDVNNSAEVDLADAIEIMSIVGGLNDDVTVKNFNTLYLGGNAAIEIVDPFVGGEEPEEPEPVKLSAPANVYAYYQDSKLYYTFDAVDNASSYTIKVGSAEPVAINATSGSITVAAWDGTGTLAVEVKAIGDTTNYTDSDAASTNAVYANVSGQLASWLSANGLSDVAITVYEITAAE